MNARFRGFSPDRIIHAPTDISLIAARVQVLSDSDAATASELNQGITLAPFNPTGEVALFHARVVEGVLGTCNIESVNTSLPAGICACTDSACSKTQ